MRSAPLTIHLASLSPAIVKTSNSERNSSDMRRDDLKSDKVKGALMLVCVGSIIAMMGLLLWLFPEFCIVF